MAKGVVADNWSLQDIASLLLEGFNAEPSGEIVVSDKEHSYKAVSSAVIQTEALFDLLTDIILRDEILVDEKFTYAWEDEENPILEAKNFGIIRSYPFLNEPQKLNSPRDNIVNHICSTNPLKQAHQENVDGWAKNRQTPDPLLSATLWGGAGMCARSFVYEKSYTPHPLRKRLFLNSGFMLPAEDALHQVTTFLEDNRLKVSKKMYGNDSLYSMYLNLPSIPVRVIQESSHPDQFISIAIEMRKEFQQIREWLKSFQNAISSENTETILEKRKQLDSVKNHIDAKLGSGSIQNPVSMEAGIGIFKMALNIENPISYLKNQFGVRATLNRLIFGSRGKNEIARYTSMFGEKNSSIGYEVQKYFTSKT